LAGLFVLSVATTSPVSTVGTDAVTEAAPLPMTLAFLR
jgi:hypothetical protein